MTSAPALATAGIRLTPRGICAPASGALLTFIAFSSGMLIGAAAGLTAGRIRLRIRTPLALTARMLTTAAQGALAARRVYPTSVLCVAASAMVFANFLGHIRRESRFIGLWILAFALFSNLVAQFLLFIRILHSAPTMIELILAQGLSDFRIMFGVFATSDIG